MGPSFPCPLSKDHGTHTTQGIMGVVWVAGAPTSGQGVPGISLDMVVSCVGSYTSPIIGPFFKCF